MPDMSYVVKDLTLLGDKSLMEKNFTLQEIIDNDYRDGFYKEGIQPDEVSFKLEFEISNPCVGINASYKYFILSQIAIWDNNFNPIVGLTLEKHNCYIFSNLDNKFRKCVFLKDADGYRYELYGFNWTTGLNANHFKPGGAFGPPMCTGSTYLFCSDWWVNKDGTVKNNIILQTDNPNVKVMSVSFNMPTRWFNSTTTSGGLTYSYAPGNVKVNGEELYNLTTNAALISHHFCTDSLSKTYWLRYIFEKQSDNTYKTYKDWLPNIYNNNMATEGGIIKYDIRLLGQNMNLPKVFSLKEIIDNDYREGIYDDFAGNDFTLDLQIIQKWTTYNTGEFLVSGGLIWDNSSNIYEPYSKDLILNKGSGTLESVSCPDTNTGVNKLTVHIVSSKQPQALNYSYSSIFGKNVQATHGYSAKNVPVLGIVKTGGVNGECDIKMVFFGDIKAFALDTMSIYDYKYNGTNTQSRHVGYLKSLTHNKILHNVNSVAEWLELYTVTINSILYAARLIFTKTNCFLVYMDVTNTKYLIIDRKCYIHHILTNEMLEYTIDELIEMNRDGRIDNGKYVYTIVPVNTFTIRLTKTFENTDNEMGIHKVALFEKTTNSNMVSNYDIISDTQLHKGNKLYEIDIQGTMQDDTKPHELLSSSKTLLLDNQTATDIAIKTDNPNVKRMKIIPWYFSKEVIDTTDQYSQNFVGKLEINNNLVYEYADVETFRTHEFKTVHDKLYGSCYLYDIESNTYKKCWVLIQNNEFVGEYLYYANDVMGKTDIDDIFDNPRSDGSSDEEYTFIPCKTFRLTLLPGTVGAYGGAPYRVYPIINGKVYKGAYYAGNTTASSGTQVMTIMDSGIEVITEEQKLQFINDCNTKGVFSSPIIQYSSSIGTPSLSGNMARVSAVFVGKYSNGAYYQPAYVMGQTANANNTYFLGTNATATRAITFTINDVSQDLGDINIEGLIIIPWRNGSNSGRYCLNQRYELIGEDGIILNSIDTSTNTYKGYYLSTDGTPGYEIM